MDNFYHTCMFFARIPIWLRRPIYLLLGFLLLWAGLYASVRFTEVVSKGTEASAQIQLVNQQVRARIKPGSNVAAISQQLQGQGVKVHTVLMQVASRTIFLGRTLKAGTYDFPMGSTTYTVLDKMTRGDSVKVNITVVEGTTFKQFRALVDSNPDLVHTTKSWSNQRLLRELTADFKHPEGIFYPTTYVMQPGDTDLAVYQKAHQLMVKTLNKIWDSRQSNLALNSPYELLKLASIIEKETGQAQDRAMISSVFHNRLKIGMKLQTDPTIIYGLGDAFDGNLRKKDLLKDGAYNTYTRYGLPPTPIALPSKASLEAAATPATSKALFFVSKGDGSSYFSETLAQHEQAVRKYQLK